jgi:hypothetical protein
MASGSRQTTIRLGNGREQTLEYLKEATGESTNTGALFAAAAHYLEDKRQKEKIADELDREHLEALSTSELPLRRGDTEVGPFNE